MLRKTTTSIAKKLRQNQTEAEKYLWSKLRAKQLHDLKFRRQQPIENYIVDFVCFEKRLIIEIDGGQHAENTTDQKRDDFLKSKGFLVLRFWNNDVLDNINRVLQTIVNTIHPHLNPPPQGEEEKRTPP